MYASNTYLIVGRVEGSHLPCYFGFNSKVKAALFLARYERAVAPWGAYKIMVDVGAPAMNGIAEMSTMVGKLQKKLRLLGNESDPTVYRSTKDPLLQKARDCFK